MKMRRVMAVKAHKYGTRHLVAGEEYELPARHALALLAGRKVRYAADSPRPPAKPAAAQQPLPPDHSADPAVAAPPEIERLRIDAERLGIEVDGRWGTIRLQHEIAKARG